MVFLRLLLLVLLLALLCLASCDGDRTIAHSNASRAVFPNAVGMLWVYDVYDSLTAQSDTVWVSITDTVTLLPGGASLLWRMRWVVADSVENQYVVTRGDTTEIWSDTIIEPDRREWFVFPLRLGAQWHSWMDSAEVVDTGTVSVPAGSFRNSALVSRSWMLDFEGGGKWSQTWISPDVGIVKRHLHRQYSDGQNITVTVNQTWELVHYDLSTFALNQFPNTVGMRWVYQVVDTSLDLIDTVTVTITGKVPVSWADMAKVWQYVGSELADTLYVGRDGNRIMLGHGTRILYFDDRYYEFPLAVGRHWGQHRINSVPIIEEKGPVQTPAGIFPAGFRYTMGGGVFNDYWWVEEWLVPGVGVVAARQTRFGLGPMYDREWTLLSYDVRN